MQDNILVDKLTGLYNKKYFEKRLISELARAQRYKRPLSLLLFEIDYNYFVKEYDIKWGMSYSLLKQFGALILKIYRNVDIAGRYEGEMFITILPETPTEGGAMAGERLRKAVEEHTFIGDTHAPQIKIAINVGVVSYPQNGKDIEELVSAANDAVLEARKEGGNKVVVSKRTAEPLPAQKTEG